MIIKSRDLTFMEDGSINLKMISNCIAEHLNEVPRLNKLQDYYMGKHDILNRAKSNSYCANERSVHNFSKYIVDTIIGYVFGQPISYDGLTDDLFNHLTIIDEDSHNIDMAKNMGIFGKSFELIYIDDELSDKPMPYLATLSPINTFIVYDNTVKCKPLFGCTYSANEDINGEIQDYSVIVYTEYDILTFRCKDIKDAKLQLVDEEQHMFGGIPLIELSNNKESIGDFEGVISLIDLYNILENDRVNDIEQLCDSLLVISNMSLGDDEEEVSETVKFIRDNRILEVEDGGDAKYVTRSLNQSEVEILKKAIENDIHKFSCVPNMSDENFIGANTSGIAYRYKILNYESLGIVKERMFKQLLRKRFKLISNIEKVRGTSFDLGALSITMKRTLPVDLQERLQIVQGLEGILSLRTRIQMFDEELDIEEELKRIEEENTQRDKQMSQAFMQYSFPQQDNNEDTEEDTEQP